jgi:lisH domain-containing protein FOPNL
MNEMKDVLKEQLEKDGSLNEVRAKLRSHLFNTLNNNQKSKQNLSNQDLIMGELIREYLTFRNLNYANSVMIPEAGLPERPLDRGIIANQLNVEESSETRQLPLLYSKVQLRQVSCSVSRAESRNMTFHQSTEATILSTATIYSA